MIDGYAKTHLHDGLRWIREAMLSKLDGLSEYDIRRPLTPTWNQPARPDQAPVDLGGQVLRRGGLRASVPRTPASVGRRGRARRRHVGDRARDTRRGRRPLPARVWEHSDATINALDIAAPGHVPWWPRPDVKLFNILVHALRDQPHAGHADILREQLARWFSQKAASWPCSRYNARHPMCKAPGSCVSCLALTKPRGCEQRSRPMCGRIPHPRSGHGPQCMNSIVSRHGCSSSAAIAGRLVVAGKTFGFFVTFDRVIAEHGSAVSPPRFTATPMLLRTTP
jgi:hypothetical protein